MKWFLANDKTYVNNTLDFVRCESDHINVLFPSRFPSKINVPHRLCHTAKSIRDFQSLGEKQKKEKLKTQNESITNKSPVTYPSHVCISLRLRYVLDRTKNENRKQIIAEGFNHLIREAIRARADSFRNNTFHSFQHLSGFLVDSKTNKISYTLHEVNLRNWDSRNVANNYFFPSN